MMNGILRIQTYRPRQSAPVEGVTVVITGSGFTAHRITDAEGNAEDVAICAPACALSLDENNTTTLPYAVCSLTARKPGYRTVRIQGIQIFAGQVTLARPEMIPPTLCLRGTAAAARPPPSTAPAAGCWTVSSCPKILRSIWAGPPPRPGT